MKQIFLTLFIATLTIVSCSMATNKKDKSKDETVNHYPEYGHIKKSLEQVRGDSEFISATLQQYGNLKMSSKHYSAVGWDYFGKGILDTAMFRFNQAWLLDSTNAKVHWGFAALEGRNGNDKESIMYFKKSWSLDSTNINLPVDWSIPMLSLYNQTKDKSLIAETETILNKSIHLDNNNANAYFKLAICDYYLENYTESWTNIHKCRALNEQVINEDFVQTLLIKFDDPKGIYKKKK